MDPATYEYQSDFAKRYIALGRQEGERRGRQEGRADLVTHQLTLRFGALSTDVVNFLAEASLEELNAIGERLLTASSLDEALAR